jgi:O-antigen/teichoic acid export membrane protein
MGIIIRQSFKTSLAAYVGVLLGAFNILWLFPKFLNESEIGIIKLLEDLAIMIAGLSGLGVTYIADRYFPFFKNIEKKNQGFFQFLLIYAGLGFLIFGLILGLFKDYWLSFYAAKSPDFQSYFYLLFPFAGVWALLNVLESYARVHLRIAVPNFLRETVLKILIILSIFLFALQLIDFQTLVLFRIILYIIIALILFFYLKNLQILFLTPDFQVFKNPKLPEILRYGFWIMLGGAGTLVIVKIDSILIPILLGTKALGIYTIAYFLGSVLEIPRKAISQISMPILGQAWAENNPSKIQEIYQKSSLNQLLIGTYLFLGIWLNTPDLFKIIPNGAVFQSGIWVVFWVGLTRLVDLATGLSSEILYQSKFYKVNLFLLLILAVLIIFSANLLIPIYGISGAAMAIFISYTLFNFLKFGFLWYRLNLQPFTYKALYILLLGAICLILNQLQIDTALAWLNIFIRGAWISALFAWGVWFFKISPEVNEMMDWLLRLVRKALKFN